MISEVNTGTWRDVERRGRCCFVLLVSLLPGCHPTTSEGPELREEWAVPLDGSFHGIRGAESILQVGKNLLLLDARSEKVQVLNRKGEFEKSVPVRRFSDGTVPTLLARGPGGSVLFASYAGSRCRLLTSDLSEEFPDCTFPPELGGKYRLLSSSDGLFVLGRVQASSNPIHLLHWVNGRWRLVNSMGRLHRLADSDDSHRVLQGVDIGIGSFGFEGVVHTQINPVELVFFSPDGERVWSARPTRGLAPLSDFVGDKGLSPLIPYVTGVEVWEDLVLLSAYSASEDFSSLWLFDKSGAEIAFLKVPFKIRVRGHVGEIVAMERWIGPPELSGYSLDFGLKPRN